MALYLGNEKIAGSGSAASITLESIGAAPIDHTHIIDDITDGVLPIEKGGTGGSTAEQVRNNISAAPMYDYGTEDLIAGTSPLETGKLYFVYE